MKSFEEVWRDLRNHLRTGIEIPNWTVDKGYLGDKMTITEMRPSKISVDTPFAEKTQEASKSEFDMVWKVWDGYNSGKVSRKQICDMTRHSKYIISILHWYEVEVQTKGK